jgi:Beta-lactamase enzyme family
MKKIIALISLNIFALKGYAQEDFLKKLMESKPEQFSDILQNQQKYEVQILYTQINRDKNNKPSFKTFSYEVNADRYFYPASTVKLPASLLALEKINKLNIKGLIKESTMITLADFEKQTEVKVDSTAENGLPSIAHYIKKILMVSDNDAFNRLYEFVGQKAFNESMWKKGYSDTRIVHRLQIPLSIEQNKHTNPIKFYNKNEVIYAQNGQYNAENYFPKVPIKKGIGYMDANDKLINEPLDFTLKNKFGLADQHNLMKALIFPNSVKKKQQFNLTETDYNFIYKYMSQLPTESTFPNYPAKDYWPTYCKFAMFGSEKDTKWPNNIRVFNKVGDAYGFLLDNAYIVDYEAGIEFMLTAVLLCNNDQIFNDDKYDYETVGFPFMKNLGKLIYDFEIKREKKYKPNLDKMKFVYDKN